MGMVDNIKNTKRKSRIWFISIVLLLSAISINTLANEVMDAIQGIVSVDTKVGSVILDHSN